jgi:hypothetical protein
MRFESRTLWLSKDIECPQFYEDAFALDAERGVAAIADGVAAGMFSGLWARLLTERTVAQPPNLDDGGEFQAWLAGERAAWAGQIDFSKLTWFQREKLKQANGAASTLLWLTLTTPGGTAGPPDSEPGGTAGLPGSEDDTVAQANRDIVEGYRLQSIAIGDCCLFHLRDGQTLRSFPMECAADFGLNPGQLGSIDESKDHLLEFKIIEDDCFPGDLLVLCTDALAHWALERWEAGEPVAWENYWDMPAEAWQEEITALRQGSRMRYDDTTLVLLRVVDETAPVATLPPEGIEPAEAEEEAAAEAEEPAMVEADEAAGEEAEEPTGEVVLEEVEEDAEENAEEEPEEEEITLELVEEPGAGAEPAQPQPVASSETADTSCAAKEQRPDDHATAQ